MRFKALRFIFEVNRCGSFYCKFFIGISIGLPSFCAAASCRDPDEDINGNELSVFIMGGSTISRNTEVLIS